MEQKDKEEGVVQVSVQHFEQQVLPRVVEIKQKLDDGDTMNEFDIEVVTEALQDAHNFLPHLEEHPEYKALFSQIVHYYKLITDEALDNAK